VKTKEIVELVLPTIKLLDRLIVPLIGGSICAPAYYFYRIGHIIFISFHLKFLNYNLIGNIKMYSINKQNKNIYNIGFLYDVLV